MVHRGLPRLGLTRPELRLRQRAENSEAAASAVMRESDVTVRVDLGLGEGSARIWTCDLTKLYIEINGDYRS